jgi:hypothetical protein
MSSRQQQIKRNQKVKLIREWRASRTRPRAKGIDRAQAWAEKPLAIWPSPTGPKYSGSVDLEIPKRFSVIENPNETIAFLQRLRNVVGSDQVRRIHIDHKTCEHTDLCASVLMDVILMTARTHWKWTKQRIILEGSLPPVTSPLHKLLVNSGVVAHLIGPKNLPEKLSEGVHKFKLVKGGLTAPLDSARKEIVSSELAAYFTNCMRTAGFELKLHARGLLSSIVSEVLDNAELHGNADGRWYAIGYFNMDAANAIDSSCHIVLFNFGDSVYQSLKRKDGSPELRARLKELSKRHESGLLDRGDKFRESTLWSLYALQEGVSRLAHEDGEVARGGGTVDMMRFFNELSAGDQRMAIVSGDAYILNDGTYEPRKDKNNNTVLAFNADNDLNQAPNPGYVRALDHKFPGTLISLRFPFNKDHLEKLSLSTISASDGDNRFSQLVIHVDTLKKT